MSTSRRPVNGFRRARRYLYGALVALTTLFAIGLLTSVFQQNGITPLELLLLILYAALFGWICASFWTATLGFFLCLLHRNRFAPSADRAGKMPDTDAGAPAKTAIVMPIYNEDAQRVFAGLRAIYQSLLETGEHDRFELFILSDTRDPDIWIEEETRWESLCQDLDGKGRIFYRNRAENIGRKSGNIADFCEHWGGRYRYMITIDADSIMDGSTLVQMVRLMEMNPRAALIQAPPLPVGKESLFARILQFAANIYGRMFTAGLNFWQLDGGNYWGHNAIIRVEPFVTHCGLPKLPGKEPFGGEILSHDFVESALLRRAGWEVWLAYDLGGSYEEIPPTLIDYAKRDRRWCQGNLQHLRMIFARGFRSISRVHFLMGVMSYLASPLWFLFLMVTGIEAFIQAQTEPVYFFGDSLFPNWPVSYAVQMTTVLAVTLAILFLPKLFGLILLFREPKRLRSYGGAIRVTLGTLLESVFSVLLAPILMLFQTKFVLAILFRRAVGWPAQQRGDHQTGFKEAALAHANQTLIGIAAGVLSYVYVPNFFWWFTPVLAGLVFAVPISMFSSSIALGRRARELGLFLTPQETDTPRVLTLLREHVQAGHRPLLTPPTGSGFIPAIVEPFVNALHASLLPDSTPSKRRRHYLDGLIYKLLEEGPDSLSAAEKRELLSDRETVLRLHTLVWSLPQREASLGHTPI